MDKQTLLIFAQRIFNSSSTTKAMASLNQLKRLLEEQGAPVADVALLASMIRSAPEMKEMARRPMLTEQDVEIAERRAKERERREQEARHYGRC